MSENWERWEHEVVNGVFPLHRTVRNSGHSAVFLTEHKSKAIPEALLKLVPAIPTFKQAQLEQWSIASRLSHPCVARLLDTGSCQLGGLSFLYVVTEYAQASLAQILETRALELEEFKKLMRPVLEGLSFLHRQQLVHGGLEPSSLLMFKERLKLASDAVRPAGESSASLSPASEFDPPESRDGSYSAAGDVWSLGVLIVEALTQKRPKWPDKTGGPVLPKSLPAALVGVVMRCLNRNPARRPTVEQLDAEINPMWPVYLASERSLLPAFAFAAGPVVNDLPVVQPPPVVFPRSELQVASTGRPEPTITVPLIPAAGPELAIAMPMASGSAIGRVSSMPVVSGPAIERASTVPVDLGAAAGSAASPGVSGTSPSVEKPAAGPIDLAAANEPIVEPTVVMKQPPKRGMFLVRAAMIVSGVVAAGWIGAVMLSRQVPAQPAAAPAPPVAAVTVASTPVQVEKPPPAEVAQAAAAQPNPRAAVHEEIPDVPEKALATIHGRMLFAIRITVDPEGRAVHAVPVGNRSSQYFARLCTEAAMRWKFAPADTIAARKWLVHFEFTRGGVVAHAS